MSEPNLIDTHCHLDGFFRRGELPAVLDRARDAGVGHVIAIGTEPEDWELYGRIAAADPRVSRTIGLHPCAVGEDWRGALDRLERCWDGKDGPEPVALGECGLDRFHLPNESHLAEVAFGRQRAAFEAQLAFAKTRACPVVVHSRQAFGECVDLIAASGVDFSRVVFHCFSEGPAEIAVLNQRGGRGSFTGILTYKNAESVRAAAKTQGLGTCMVETDAPYLAPVPHRGKANEPAFVRHTAEAAAELLGVTLVEFAAATTANARRFFGVAS
ncbi:MAG: TatD family hydrolase [Opitutaceae bacterium]